MENKMKKRIFALILVVLSVLLMFSCRPKDNGGNGGKTANVIFSAEVEVNIVKSAAEKDEKTVGALESLANTIAGRTAKRPMIVDDGYFELDHEIVVGDTVRDISAKAKAKLNSAIRNGDPEKLGEGDRYVGYAVYSSGTSVAIVWSDSVLAVEAIEYFIEEFVVSDSLTLSDGYIKTQQGP